MLRDTVDPLAKSVQPAIITGRKWNAKYTVETAESSFKMKEEIGFVATGRAGFGLTHNGGCQKRPQRINEEWFLKRFIILRKVNVFP